MAKKSLITKLFGIGLIAATISFCPSISYETSSNLYLRSIQQETKIAKKVLTEINGETLQKKIIEENLNTGKYSPEQAVGMLGKSVQEAGGLPEYMDEGFVYSLVDKESKWNPKAKSKKDARGLVQITEDTWQTYNPKVSYAKVWKPQENLKAAIKVINGHEKYFREMHPNWEIVSKQEKLKIHAAAYNWGKGNLKRIGWNLTVKKTPYETRVHVEEVLKMYTLLLS